MKLYFHPVSTTSRPIVLFAADSGIPLELEVVDLFTGAHLQPAFAAINPSRQVPVLEDGDFRLTESSAILKYLAEKVGSPAYPADDIRRRARINETMDWLNTGLYRDLGYGLIYPQVLPNYRREDPEVQGATLEWGARKARDWLTILDRHIIGDNRYLCGDTISIADYLGMGMLTLGEVTKCDYSGFPNVCHWLADMRDRPSYAPTHEAFYLYFVAPYKDAKFVGL